METSRPLQHSSITLIGSDHYSIAPCLHYFSVALSHRRSQSQKWIFDINSMFTLFLFLCLSVFILFYVFPPVWQKCVEHLCVCVSFSSFTYFSPSVCRLWWVRAWCTVCSPNWRRVPSRRAASMLEAAASTPSYAGPCASSVRPTTNSFWGGFGGRFRN